MHNPEDDGERPISPNSHTHSPTISPRQLAANRENAKRATGPKSPGGKARSAFNALTHGLFARDVVLAGEDRQAYDALVDAMFNDFAPQGDVEEGLARRAADLWWRLGRTAAIEAGLLNPDWSGDPRARSCHTGGGPLVDGFRVAMDETRTLDQLGRYESRLERALARTVDMLERLQTTRRRRAQKEGGENPDP